MRSIAKRPQIAAVGVAIIGVLGLVTTSVRAGSTTPIRTFRTVATPPLPVAHYLTRGDYPQVSGDTASPINAALRRAVVDDENRYAVEARAVIAKLSKAQLRRSHGLYETRVLKPFVASGDSVVSALLPVLRLYPGGNDGEGWIATTATANGRPVPLGKIIRTNPEALKQLSDLVRNALIRSSSCVRNSLRDKQLGPHFARGLAPLAANFSLFSLRPSAITFGFEVGRVAGPICGRVSATVMRGDLVQILTASGTRLIEGIRAAKFGP